jgi:hypothetical protein
MSAKFYMFTCVLYQAAQLPPSAKHRYRICLHKTTTICRCDFRMVLPGRDRVPKNRHVYRICDKKTVSESIYLS